MTDAIETEQAVFKVRDGMGRIRETKARGEDDEGELQWIGLNWYWRFRGCGQDHEGAEVNHSGSMLRIACHQVRVLS